MLGLSNCTTTWKASEAQVQIQYSSVIQKNKKNGTTENHSSSSTLLGNTAKRGVLKGAVRERLEYYPPPHRHAAYPRPTRPMSAAPEHMRYSRLAALSIRVFTSTL